MFNIMKKFVAIREMKEETWKCLKEIAKSKKLTISEVIESLVKEKKINNHVNNFSNSKTQESESESPQKA